MHSRGSVYPITVRVSRQLTGSGCFAVFVVATRYRRPVLPAVVQVAAAVHFAGRLLGREVRLAEVSRAKFMNPTGPGRELELTLGAEPVEEGRTRVKAVLRDGDKDVAELTLRVV